MLAYAGRLFELAHRFRRTAARKSILRQHPQLQGLEWDPLTSLIDYHSLTIGRNVSIGGNAYLSGPITLGDNVMIAPYCAISAGAHRFDIPGRAIRDSGGVEPRGVVVENDVWLGYGATIIDGVKVGEGSVIAARSLVVNDVDPFTVVAGAPCRPLKPRFSEADLAVHRELLAGFDDGAGRT